MNCIHFERRRILSLNNFIYNYLKISQNLSLSSNHYSIQNNNNLKLSYSQKSFNLNHKRREQPLNDLKTSEPKTNIRINGRHERNSVPKEKNLNFDSKFGDTFGTLNEKSWTKYKRLSSEDLPDDEDGYDKLEIKRGPKMAPIGYYKLLTQLVHKKPIQIRRALELYNRMISEDRIPPDKCTYTVLISGCAKVGYTQKAFQLFEELLKNELKPTNPTITALFNACAECPFPEYGLEKAKFLREYLHLEGIAANTLHYHSMIKAFGKLGDMKTAFELVDEMVANGQSTTSETFAMLLMGCISDKDSGLFQAIKIIRKMKFHNMPLDIYTFNLLLRAIRDCGIGSQNNIKLLMQDWTHQHNDKPPKKYPKNTNQSISSEFTKSSLNENENNSFNFKTTSEMSQNSLVGKESLDSFNKNSSLIVRTPNLLEANASKEGQVIDINFESLSLPSNRFLLFGGMEGYFKMMSQYNVKPNINTLTLMLELIILNEESEQQILNALEKFKIKADTDFFNILIKQICCRRSAKDAKKILLLMQKKGLQLDIITFGVLSLGCDSLALGKQLLFDMEESGIKANTEIMGGLLTSASKKEDFWYINFLINYMKKNNISPDHKAIERIECLKLKIQKILAHFDNNEVNDLPNRYQSENFRKGFATFKANYEEWLQNVIIVTPEHPWDQFKFDEIKNKKAMHNFVKFMKQKIDQKTGKTDHEIDSDEEDELYND
jgi:pentatricopeptide repeat domain-containing protein 1